MQASEGRLNAAAQCPEHPAAHPAGCCSGQAQRSCWQRQAASCSAAEWVRSQRHLAAGCGACTAVDMAVTPSWAALRLLSASFVRKSTSGPCVRRLLYLRAQTLRAGAGRLLTAVCAAGSWPLAASCWPLAAGQPCSQAARSHAHRACVTQSACVTHIRAPRSRCAHASGRGPSTGRTRLQPP